MSVDAPQRDPMNAGRQAAGDAPPAAPDILAALKHAGSAEEFFALLGVAYDPKVLDIARLHILKRAGEYLASEDIDRLPADIATARCTAALERAYADFVASSPLRERVFKVLKPAVEAPAASQPAPFLPLDRLFA